MTATKKSAGSKQFKPKHIALMYRPGNPEAVRLGNELAQWLLEQKYIVYSTPGQKLGRGTKRVTDQHLDKLDWIIVLGGDGTYLRAASMLNGKQIPILGVNMGSLGFLTVCRSEDLYKQVLNALQGKMEIRTRSQISVEIRRNGRKRGEFIALNDVVLERGSSTHLINLAMYNQRHLVANIKADALIIASPTGSTAYNLAAGGPILHPDVRAMVVTPVCPHSLTSRPLIFPDDQHLSFRVLSKDKQAIMTVDGVRRGELTPDDEVFIVRSSLDHLIVRKSSHNFFALLREKLRFGERD